MSSSFRVTAFIIASCFLLPVLAQSKKEVACPNCFHLQYKTRNLPPLAKWLVEMFLSGLKLSNPECANNKVVPDTCSKPILPFLMENKCTTAKIKLKAVGMKSLFPDAELDVSVVFRICEAVVSGTPDECVNINELGATEKAKVTKSLKQVEAQWTKVTYSGTICTKTP